jgi:LPS-assembly protein
MRFGLLALQQAFASVPFGIPMPKTLQLIVLLVCATGWARAEITTPHDLPVEITASGETRYENGIATASDNVAIHFGDSDIYGDHVRYNSATREVFMEGHVRIYRGVNLYVGESATYNLDTSQIHATNMQGDFPPFFISGADVLEPTSGEFVIKDGVLTTHDSSNPTFHIRASTIRFYQNDRVVFQNATFYVGKIPIFWWPYLYQSLNDSFSFMVSPAYLSSWGPTILGQVTFPITDQIKARIRLDYRTRRGPAIGFDPEMQYGTDKTSFARLHTYLLNDQDPNINRTTVPRDAVGTTRYVVSLQDRTYFREDLYATVNVTKLSDSVVLQDFFPNVFRVDPQPDNVVALTKSSPNYTLTTITRFQANSFFDVTERLPEVVLDVNRQALFGGPIFYEGETGMADLHRNFASGSGFVDYGSFRADSFHQFLYPNTYFGWLSVVPRVGFRGTYYGETRDLGKTIFTPSTDPLIPEFILPDPTLAMPLQKGGATFRAVVNGGVEASFKLSREWETVQNRSLGLDGLRHIIQPFTDFSWVSDNTNPIEILQFDRFEPSTQLPPIDFPQFTPIDSIANWSIWKVGVRNKLQTRRDDLTISWLEMETYVEVNFDNPFDRTQYSNLYNRIRFNPLPWVGLTVESQVPAFDKGFTEINSRLSFQPIANLQVAVGQRYLQNNPFFLNSNLITFDGFYRVNDNWGFGVQEQYEGSTGLLEEQRYSIYRDLTSWVASLGAVVRDNGGGVKEYGMLLTFTLKAFPKLGFDFNMDPSGTNNQTIP